MKREPEARKTTTRESAPVTGIDAVFIYVEDLERSIHFYRDLLGIPLGVRDGDWVEGRFPSGVRFALHQAHPGREPQTPGSVIVDFRVADLDAAATGLRAKGVRVEGPRHEAFGSLCEVFDPDGYRIQLFHPSA